MPERGRPERGLHELQESQRRAERSREVLDSADKVLEDIRALSSPEDFWAALVKDTFRGM